MLPNCENVFAHRGHENLPCRVTVVEGVSFVGVEETKGSETAAKETGLNKTRLFCHMLVVVVTIVQNLQ